MEEFTVSTGGTTSFHKITGEVEKIISSAGASEGICVVYVPHTTCGITINEAADPDVEKDIQKELNKVIPFNDNYAHGEGNSAAHIKTSLMGSSVTIPVVSGKLSLGTWQGIFLTEFDGPRTRKVRVQVISSR